MAKSVKRLTVGKLRQLIEGLDDNTIILRPSDDHSYTPADGYVATAGFSDKYQEYFEWYGQEQAGGAEVPVPAVIIE